MSLPRLTAGLCFAITLSSALAAEPPSPPVHPSFDVRPERIVENLTKTKPQEGTPNFPLPTRKTFREVTIAQGSGLDGFDCIRIFADGKGYAVVSLPRNGGLTKGIQVPIQLSSAQLDQLLAAMQLDHVHQIKGQYSTDLADGTQGFVEVASTAGRIHSWLDNYFEPVAHLYEFCNAQIWPGVRKSFPRHILDRRHDLQEEYHRIFKD